MKAYALFFCIFESACSHVSGIGKGSTLVAAKHSRLTQLIHELVVMIYLFGAPEQIHVEHGLVSHSSSSMFTTGSGKVIC